MLFDLRSRGRRRTVQAVYLGLALLMGGGLVLFGVGAGNGFGGILNAFTGNGSGNNQKQVISQAEKTALKQTQQQPENPAAWAALVSARDTNAKNQVDPNTGAITKAGLKELQGEGQAWQRYIALTKSPDPGIAVLAAHAYTATGQYGNAAAAWEVMANGNPTSVLGYECLALTAYAANQTRKGDLATAKALTLVPKAQRTTVRARIQQDKAQPQLVQQDCGL
jgi:hypothetical protein